MNKKMLFVGAIGAVMSCMVVWFSFSQLVPPGGVPAVIHADKANSKVQVPQARTVQATPSPSSPAAATPESRQNFLDKYSKARSYRAFLYDVLREPKKGGLSYAFAILSQCKNAINAAANPAVQNEAKRQATTALAARCDMSEPERQDVLRQLVAARNVELTDDPALKLTFGLGQAKTPDEQIAAVAAILQNGDPSIMRSILGARSVADDSNAVQPRIYFQNQWYQGTQEVDKFNMAFQLVECQLGLDCGPESTTALVLCSEKGWCGGSVQDAIRQQLNGQSPGKFDEVSVLASQILQQIQAGNAAAFVHR